MDIIENNVETTNNKKSKKPFYKKWWSWLIAIIIICSCCSCASGNSDDDSDEEDVAVSENTETNEEESSEDTETNGEEESSGDKDSSENEKDSNDDTEIVVVDNDECAITLTGIDSDSEEGYAMTFSFENKSSVSNYGLMIPYAEISGVEFNDFNAYFNVFDAGDCEEDTIIFPADELEKTGINEISEIGLYIWIFDYDAADDVDGWRANTVVSETYCIYPDGEETAETVEYVGSDTDIVFLDNENMKASVTEVEEQDDGYVVNMYLKNITDSLISCVVGDDDEYAGFWYCMLMPGAWTLTQAEISESILSEAGVTDFSSGIENRNLLFIAFDYLAYEDDHTAEYFANTNFTLQSLIDGEELEDSSDEEAEEDTTNTESEDTSEITSGMSNVLQSAKKYLSHSTFSYTGIIEQLEYEGYSTEEATYAADNCGADWNEQAVAKAESYLEHTSFSHSELINQLEFEGYTSEEAEYAADAVGY